MAQNSLVLQDRADSNKWKITIEDGLLKWEITADAAATEPIVQDVVSGLYYRFFMNDGNWAQEITTVVQDDDITLIDSVTTIQYKLQMSDGQFSYVQQTTGEMLYSTDFRYGDVLASTDLVLL